MSRGLSLFSLTFLLTIACSDSSQTPSEQDEIDPSIAGEPDSDQTDHEAEEERWSARVDELEAEAEAIEAETETLRGRIGEIEEELARAQVSMAEAEQAITQGDADAKAQAAIAGADRRRLESQLEATKAALDAANAQLADRRYDDAIAELKATRVLLEQAENARAQAPGTLNLNVALRFQTEAFALNHAYPSANGTLSFSALRYWLSNLVLNRSDDTRVVIPNAYYLMGAMNAQTLENGTQRTLTLPAQRRELVALSNVPPGSYKSVEFQVGVDAAHNDDLSLVAGELNVLRNMTGYQWMWFTSYIFTKTVASFTPAAAPSTPLAVQWENGTNDDLRSVRLNLGAAATVRLGERPQINLELDVAKVVANIDPNTTPVIGATDAAPRTLLADNWMRAFQYQSVTHQQ